MMEVGQRYRHLKRGTSYSVVAIGQLQVATASPAEGDRIVAYRGGDGDTWFRAETEFLDGRFDPIELGPKVSWGWYHASDEESSCTGPYQTREDAVAEGMGYYGESFYVCEAINPPVRLAEWIGADRLIERADEEISESDRVASEYDDGPYFECTAEQEKDLEERIKRACDEWQAAHGLVFHCNTFEEVRNGETVKVPAAAEASDGTAKDAADPAADGSE